MMNTSRVQLLVSFLLLFFIFVVHYFALFLGGGG